MEFLGCADVNVDRFDSSKPFDRFDSCQEACCFVIVLV